ncbi:MAG: hypothetical protein WDN31_05150 [Hyphomicrobium sp.]
MTDVRLDVDERKLVRVVLKIASVSEAVEVSAATDIIQSEQGSLGQVIRGMWLLSFRSPPAATRIWHCSFPAPPKAR